MIEISGVGQAADAGSADVEPPAGARLRRHRGGVSLAMGLLVLWGVVEAAAPANPVAALTRWALLLTFAPAAPFFLQAAYCGLIIRTRWTAESFAIAPLPAPRAAALVLVYLGPALSGLSIVMALAAHPDLAATISGRRAANLGWSELLLCGGLTLYLLYKAFSPRGFYLDAAGLRRRARGPAVSWTALGTVEVAWNPRLKMHILTARVRGSGRRIEQLAPGPDTPAGAALRRVINRFYPPRG
jgi:hypothetical protein